MSQSIRFSKREIIKSEFSKYKDVFQGNQKLKENVGYASMTKEQKAPIKDYRLNTKNCMKNGAMIVGAIGFVIGLPAPHVSGVTLGAGGVIVGGIAGFVLSKTSNNRFTMYKPLTKLKKEMDKQQAIIDNYVEKDPARDLDGPFTA
jgi:hypothetical protein